MRVALLTNFIAPYRVPLFEALQARVGELRIFLSTPLEPNRDWPVQWGALDVVVQRTLTVRKQWKHPAGFADTGYVHLPYDTVPRLCRYRPDAIISGELGHRTALAAAYRRAAPRTRLAIWATVSERTERGRGRLRDAVRPWLLREADRVLVNGASGARYVQALGVEMSRVVPVPYTIDPGAFCQAAAPRSDVDPVRLLAVGQLVPRKGLQEFLPILAEWGRRHPERRVDFLLAGDGPLREWLARAPVPPNVGVRLLGNVGYADLPALYGSADLLALPTLADEWGVVVNEAMAAGLPVLGSLGSQAVEELVDDGLSGWTFAAGDAPGMQSALDRALEAPAAVRRRMGSAARRRALALSPGDVAVRIAEALGA